MHCPCPSARPSRTLRPRALLVALALGLALFALPVKAGEDGTVDLPRFPAISPDGSEIVFSWAGDLWRAPIQGGDARRLTRHRMDDLHSAWSPDGEWITFTSLRDGYLNLWRIHRDGSRLMQLTHSDRHLRSPAWGRNADGHPTITFSGMLEADVYREQRPYRLSPAGGEPIRLHDAFGSEPVLSPNGTRTAFTRGASYHGWNRRHYRGPDAMNVWLHDHETGEFQPLTSRDGDDGSARWLDDDTLILMSDRELDTVNLYQVTLDDNGTASDFQRLTDFESRDVQSFDVAPDGRRAVFHVWDQLYRLDLDDPRAEPETIRLRGGQDGRDDIALRRIDRDVSEAALSPDGQVMAYIAHGRVYVRHVDPHSPTRAVTPGSHARHEGLAWSPDGLRLYFHHDRDGTTSIHEARVALTRQEIRESYREQPGRPDTGGAGGDGTPPEPGRAGPMDPDMRTGDVPPPMVDEPTDPFGPMDPTDPPDPADPGAMPAPPEPEPDQPPDTPQALPEVELDPPEEDEGPLPPSQDPSRWHDAVHFTTHPVIETEFNDRDVRPSPDGRKLAFRRGRGDLVVRDRESRVETVVAEGWDATLQWRWSPDSTHLAYSQNDLDFSANIFIVPADGSRDPINITRHPRNDRNPRWSADGRKLTFISNRSGESFDLYRVHLDRALERYTARERTTYFRDLRKQADKLHPLPAPGASAPRDAGRIDPVGLNPDHLENAWRRVQRVTTAPSHQYGNEVTPAGDRYVFNSANEGLITVNWDGSERRRLGPVVDVQHLSLTGDRLVYVAEGRAGIVRLSDGEHQRPDISDRIRIDLRAQSVQKFREAARVIEEGFYRPDLKGLDWDQLVSDYEGLIHRARTPSEFSEITNRLMGELAASHMGVSNPGLVSEVQEPSGRLGIGHERIRRTDGRIGYRVTRVVPDGPADRSWTPLEAGDIVTRIDLEPLRREETLLQRLRGTVGREVVVTFDRPAGEDFVRQQALITPVDFEELSRLEYDAFRQAARDKVHERSDGRLGYIHIQAMNQASLETFQGELYAAAEGREGLLIDVRNNGGGHTTDRILTSIMAPDHAYTLPGGADPARTGHYPQDRLDAPRYTLPVNMLANEKSYSNAEILAHAFRTLDRGTLVGEQTYGGVISTGSHTLIDGATVRRPFRGWYLPDGTDMEHHGARPHLHVRQTPEDEEAERDRQLKHAVDDLLKRIDEPKADEGPVSPEERSEQ